MSKTKTLPRPVDDYDVAAWRNYYVVNPDYLRAVGADVAPGGLIDMGGGGGAPDPTGENGGGAGDGAGDGAGPDGGAGGDNAWMTELNGEQFQIPENFRGQNPGEINAPAALKAAMDLRQKVEEMGKGPEIPDAYELRVPDEIKEQVERMGGLNAQHPLAQGLFAFAKENKLGQDVVDGLVAIYAKNQVEDTIDPGEEHKRNLDMLGDHFGDQKEGKLTEITQWVNARFKKNFDAHDPDAGKIDPVAQELLLMNESAGGIMLLDMMRQASRDVQVPGGDGNGAPRVTEADLDKLMASDKYLAGDPSTVAEVEAMAKALKPGVRNVR